MNKGEQFTERGKTEKTSENQEKDIQSISLEDMKEYHKASEEKLKEAMFLNYHVSEKSEKKLEELDGKIKQEKEKLIGPAFSRFEITSDNKKREEVVSFLEGWTNLSQEEKLERLNRTWNELEVMKPSGETERKALKEAMVYQEQMAKDYEKEMTDKNTKPLTGKEDKEWEKLVDIYKTKGISVLGMSRTRRMDELGKKAVLEAELLVGPEYNSPEFLMAQRNIENYLKFLEKWDALPPEEKEKRASRAQTIKERYSDANMRDILSHGRLKSVFDVIKEKQPERWKIIEWIEKEEKEKKESFLRREEQGKKDARKGIKESYEKGDRENK